MKVYYIKLGIIAILFICLYSNVNVGDAVVVWSEDFNDGGYDGWIVRWGNWTAADNNLQALSHPEKNEGFISHPSSISYGTWSFDIFLKPGKEILFFFMTTNHTYGEGGYNYLLEIKPFTSWNEFYLVKVLGEYPKDQVVLAQKNVIEDLTQLWHHIDITRDITGRLCVYLDSTLIFEIIDTSIDTSEYFNIVSPPEGSKIDNIEVSDEIRIWSDDFNDGNYDGWTIELGEWTVINETLQGQNPDLKRPYCALFRPSTVAYGTWSFDIRLQRFRSLYFSFIDNNSTFGEFGYYYELEIEPYSDFTNFILFKNEGSHFDSYEALYSQGVYEVLDGAWHHVDITRELNGKFSVYLDSELLFVVVDNNIVTSEEFWIGSQQYGSFIDNILVTDIVKYPMDITVDLYEAQVTQGDTVTVSAQIKDKFGDPIEGADVRVKMDDLEVIASDQQEGMYQALLDTSELLGMVEILVTAHKPDYLVSKSTHHIEVFTPASFVTAGLSLHPSIVERGKQVTVTVEVENVGGREGSYQLLVDIEGVVREEITVTLDPGASKTVFYEFFAAQAGTFAVNIGGLTDTLTVLEPASFEVSNLSIEPDSVREGEPVSITVECSNTGGVSGSYDVVLKIDGETEDTKSVTVDAGESTTVTFQVLTSESGTYLVEVHGLTGSYEVTRPGIPGYPLESVMLGLITGLIILWILKKIKP